MSIMGPVWAPNFLVDTTHMRLQDPSTTLGMLRWPKVRNEGPIVLMMLAQNFMPNTIPSVRGTSTMQPKITFFFDHRKHTCVHPHWTTTARPDLRASGSVRRPQRRRRDGRGVSKRRRHAASGVSQHGMSGCDRTPHRSDVSVSPTLANACARHARVLGIAGRRGAKRVPASARVCSKSSQETAPAIHQTAGSEARACKRQCGWRVAGTANGG